MLRLEFPGAIYHVINRGNYRQAVFGTEGARKAFERCLFQACEKYGWELHAFVVMSNHFHLAVETPQGNLVTGMQWLQSTFANRFNTLRGERGHLFQGRYKALLVEEGSALGQVCHYLHLNPVRAGLVSVDALRSYRYSSYWYLWQKPERPSFLRVESALVEAGGLVDTPKGWSVYADYLEWQAAEGPAGKNKAYASLSQGWALGSSGFKQALLKDHAVAVEAQAWGSKEVQEIREARWEQALKVALRDVSREERQLAAKSALWKVRIAAKLKDTTDVTNGWLAEKLDMGSGFYVSKHVGLLKKREGGI